MQSAVGIADKVDNKYIYTDKSYFENKGSAVQVTAVSKNIISFKKYIEPDEIEFVSPSSLYGVIRGDKLNLHNTDFTRGLAIHKLLEILPEIEKNRRNNIADIILKNFAELDGPNKDNIKKETFSVLDNRDFSFIFSSQSKAEVPVCGIFNDKFISGKIDRLIENGDEIIIIDYKTNKITESKIIEVAEKYKAQLDAYKTLLAKIYNNKKIKTGLLFTSINKIHYYD
jgi:ATP-dependent helicase/nuclease subunit A